MKRLIMASITAVVVIVVLAGTLIPILDDATAVNKTYENRGYYNVSAIDADTDITITWDPADPNVINVGTEELDLSGVPLNTAVSIVGSTSAVIRYTNNGSTVSLMYNGTGGQKIINSGGADTASIAITSSSITATLGATTKNATISAGFYADPNGDYVMKDKDVAAYVDDESVIFAGMTSISSNAAVGVYGSGNVVDGMTVNMLVENASFTLGDVTIHKTGTDCIGIYSLDSFTFDITIVEDQTVTTATYTYFVVPSEVTAEKIVHFTDGENAIFNAIPVMIIVALLLAVVAIVIRSRMD